MDLRRFLSSVFHFSNHLDTGLPDRRPEGPGTRKNTYGTVDFLISFLSPLYVSVETYLWEQSWEVLNPQDVGLQGLRGVSTGVESSTVDYTPGYSVLKPSRPFGKQNCKVRNLMYTKGYSKGILRYLVHWD